MNKIKNIKTIEQLLSTPESFEALYGMCLLFNKNSEYYKFSGIVTAALLDYEDPDKQISILAIKTSDNWHTLRCSREYLIKMLDNCDEFVGNTPEESFILQK